MSLYKDASLVMIPSAYKDGKLYSIRPTDGDGDFTFSRGSNLAATRVDVNGLIEKGRENLLLQSNTFDTTWATSNTSVTSGQSGYDESSDAWLLSKSGAFGLLQQTISSSSVSTFSVYLKAGTLNWAWIILRDSVGSNDASIYLDLSGSGALGANGGGAFIDASIVSIGSGWFRCDVTNSGGYNMVRIAPADGDGDLTGTSGSIYIQDAQLESSMVATDYIETGTSAAQSGILEDMPRLDYSGGASCPSLLLEPQRTNLIRHSEYFNNWTKVDTTITENYGISPEGVKNSTRVVFASDSDYMYIAPAGTSSGTYTTTIYIKGTNGETIKFGKGGNVASGAMHTLNGEWQRIEHITTDAGLSVHLSTFGGSTARDMEIFGCQLEQGSYPTSYIPTYGTSQTRSGESTNNMDVGSYLGSDWTAFYDIPKFTQERVLYDGINLSCSSNGLVIRTWSANGNGIVVEAKNGGITGNNHIIYRSNPTGAKIALRKIGDVVSIYADASFVGNLSLANNTGDDFDRLIMLAGNPYSLSQVLLFPTALTDSECIALTSI